MVDGIQWETVLLRATLPCVKQMATEESTLAWELSLFLDDLEGRMGRWEEVQRKWMYTYG